ncbi:MAG: GlsB/YeaQ/YmgE family stress response membrane protein [Proteobacteria bacterium]|nr:GlsB/YeaQ/YmgE family stress response membrane protein [Pseudomonadota bacterium]
MQILTILIIGLIVGALAKLVIPGKDPGGILITMLIGVAGSFVAHYIGVGMGWYYAGQPAGFIASVLGAVLLLVGYRAIVDRRG